MNTNNIENKKRLTLSELEYRAKSGRTEDIDILMETLEPGGSFLHLKMVDYALGLVSTEEGRTRVKYYLLNGNKIQRNYAALYFKRLGANIILQEAVRNGSIDEIQAFSR